MCEQALCQLVASLLPDCFMAMNIGSDWGAFHLCSIVKYKACKSALHAILIGRAKWEPISLPESTQYRVEAGVLIWTNSLCSSCM